MKTNLRRLWAAAVVLCIHVAAVAVTALPERLANFDAVAERVLTEFEVPGMAVAVVRDGEVLFARGYGVRELGKPARVEPETLFAIASNTKAFTSAMLAQLVDEKKLKWNDRVIDHLPWFAMSDPYVTREMTILDLLVHRSGLGLGAGDLLFWPATTYTTEEVVQRLRHVPLSTSFRSAYAYDNILYAAAGLVIEKVTGRTWVQNVRERIFIPVGMATAKPNCMELTAADNVATGHAKANFKELGPVPNLSWDNNSAAGGIYANVLDLAKWMNVQLAGGRLPDGADGKERWLFTKARRDEMWAMVTPIPIRTPPPEVAELKPSFSGYALGWIVNDYRGRRVVTHTGGWPGQVSRTTLVPDLKLGIVVLTNQEVGAAFQAATYQILDAFLEVPAKDWVAAYGKLNREALEKAAAAGASAEQARAKDSTPSLPLASYAGTYRDAWYGDVGVLLQDGRLVVQFSKTPQLIGDVEHWQHDTFVVRWRDRLLNADAYLTFALTPDGKVREARMEAISPLTDFSFDFHDLRLMPQ